MTKAHRQINPAYGDVSLRDRRLVLILAVLTSLFGNMGFTGLNLGLPGMEKELGLSAEQMAWVPLSTFMAMAMMAAPGAKLADIYGRRRTSLIAFAICLVSLCAGALAWDAYSLLSSRVMTGLGLAVAFTNVTAMVTSVHPPEVRGRVLGFSIASVYIGLSLGPVVCGYLVGWAGWRAIFWLSFLGFLPPMAIALMVKVEQRPAKGEPLDKNGAFLWAAAVFTVFMGLTRISDLPEGPVSVLLGLLLAAAYVKSSLKSANPVLDVRLFTGSRRFAFSSLAAFISYSASTGCGLILSLYLQYTKQLPVDKAGLLLMVQPVCQALVTPFTGRLSDKVDAGLMASAGMGIICLALTILALALEPDTPYPVFLSITMLMGVGFATFGAPNTNAIIGSAPPDKIGQASGTITATRLCGQVFSVAVTTLVFRLVIGPGRISEDKYPAFMSAATVCFSIFAPLCFTGILASIARGRKKK